MSMFSSGWAAAMWRLRWTGVWKVGGHYQQVTNEDVRAEEAILEGRGEDVQQVRGKKGDVHKSGRLRSSATGRGLWCGCPGEQRSKRRCPP